MRLEAHVLWQAVETMAAQNPINGLISDHDFMVMQQIHANAPGAKTIMLAQVKNL
jgi:hypothetical protein